MNSLYRHPLFLVFSLFIGLFSYPLAFALTPITSSGLNTQISGPIAVGSQTQFNITGGTRPGGGTNLFHSFGNFNVPNSNIANFLNNTGLPTSNILGRVTAGNVSNILGTIQTTGFGNANLFLMNPAGFLFGSNATLNVGGMVAFTSADYLRLSDGARFNAIPKASADALLTAAPVAAFGFLGSNPGAITVQGSQLSAPGTSPFIISNVPSQGGLQGEAGGISVVGGDITVNGGAVLNAPGGNVTLVSVGKPSNAKVGGEVSVAGTTTGFATMGNVTISQSSAIYNGNSLFDPGASKGTILIRGGQLVLDTAIIDSSQTTGRALTDAPAIVVHSRGTLTLQDTRVSVGAEFVYPGAMELTAGRGITLTNTVISGVTDASGAVTLTAPTISIRGGVIDMAGSHTGGMIQLNATKFVCLTDTTLDAGIRDAGGPGGTILINGGGLVTAQRTVMTARSLNNFDGDGGTIQIHANKIALRNSLLDTNSMVGQGGAIILDANKTTLTNSTLTSKTVGDLAPQGGTITITSPIVHQANSVFDASGSQGGPNGTVTINGVVQP
jgi:filamentous hemagglutinin family protein